MTEKRKCPECDVEIEGDPEECAKCKFPLQSHGVFNRLFKASVKQMTAEEAAKQPPPKVSVMDQILGKKKKA